MLVLSRKTGQGIIIDGNIRVTVEVLPGGRVKLCFDAPESVDIWREEVPFDDSPRSDT